METIGLDQCRAFVAKNFKWILLVAVISTGASFLFAIPQALELELWWGFLAIADFLAYICDTLIIIALFHWVKKPTWPKQLFVPVAIYAIISVIVIDYMDELLSEYDVWVLVICLLIGMSFWGVVIIVFRCLKRQSADNDLRQVGERGIHYIWALIFTGYWAIKIENSHGKELVVAITLYAFLSFISILFYFRYLCAVSRVLSQNGSQMFVEDDLNHQTVDNESKN